jgi:hypothetical protein
MSHLRNRRILWTGLRVLFTGAALFFLIRAIATRWALITDFSWEFRAVPLVASLVLQLAAMFFWAAIWRHMVMRSGCPIGWITGVRVYLVSNLAKYIPGSIWGYVSRVYLGEEEGLTTAGVGVSVVWELGTTIVASLLLTVSTIPFYPGEIPDPVLGLVFVVALMCFIGLLPPISNRWVRLLKRWQLARPLPHFRWRDFFLYVTCAFATHVLVGTAFFLFTRSLVDVDRNAWWSFVGIWSFSATAGLVVILAPYGLGVKEGLLVLLLQPFLPVESAVLISVASRLWTVAGELLAAGTVTLFFSVSRHLAARKLPAIATNTEE